MADKKDSLKALDEQDDLFTQDTDRTFAENTGNEGCGYDSARGSNTLPDRPGRGVGAELAQAVEDTAEKAVEKVKKVKEAVLPRAEQQD